MSVGDRVAYINVLHHMEVGTVIDKQDDIFIVMTNHGTTFKATKYDLVVVNTN